MLYDQSPTDAANSAQPKKLVRLGDLLIAAGVINNTQLQEGLCRAAETNLPLGKMLVWSGYINDDVLRSAVHVQSLVNDNSVDVDSASTWLAKEAEKYCAPANPKEDTASGIADHEGAGNRLAQLLLEAGMVEADKLEDALKHSFATSLPLGRILIYTRNVPETYVTACLDAQTAIRERRINRELAIDVLKVAKAKVCTFDKALEQLGYATADEPVAEFAKLLRLAGILSEPKLSTAQELSIIRERSLPDILLELRFLSKRVLSVLRKVRQDLLAKAISAEQAVAMLKRAAETNIELQEPVAPGESKPSVTAAELIKLARLIDGKQINKMTPIGLQAFSVTGGHHENVDNTLSIALKCVDLLEKRVLTLEQSIVVLHYCCRKGLSLPAVLELMDIVDIDSD